mgnify:CR=1 FL=1
MIDDSMVIYMVWCETTEMLYVGQSSGSLARRIAGHRHEAARGKKPCRLYDEIRLLGWDRFEVFTLERCTTRAELNERETWWIEHTSADDPALGYNVQRKSNSGSTTRAEQRERRETVSHMSDEDQKMFFSECGERGAEKRRLATSEQPKQTIAKKRGRPTSPMTVEKLARFERKRLWAQADADGRRELLRAWGRKGAAASRIT